MRKQDFSPFSSIPRNLSSQEYGRIFGEQIREARENRPIEEIAPFAGLTSQEWEAVEAGEVRQVWEQALLMATALGKDRHWMSYLVHSCSEAWSK